MTIDHEALTRSLGRLARRVSGTDIMPALHEVTGACVDIFGITAAGS